MSKSVDLFGSVPTPNSAIPPTLESQITSGDSLPIVFERKAKSAQLKTEGSVRKIRVQGL